MTLCFLHSAGCEETKAIWEPFQLRWIYSRAGAGRYPAPGHAEDEQGQRVPGPVPDGQVRRNRPILTYRESLGKQM